MFACHAEQEKEIADASAGATPHEHRDVLLMHIVSATIE